MVVWRHAYLVGIAAGLILLIPGPGVADTVLTAEPKRDVQVEPPLSAALPDAIQALPLFGSIDWVTDTLPWVDAGPYAGISGAGMVEHGGKIYVFGGFIPGGDGSDDTASHRTSRWAWRYDPAQNSWDRLSDMPVRLEYTRAVAAGDWIAVVGGGCQYKGQNPPYRVQGDCVVLDVSHDPPVWRTLPGLNVPRSHTAIGYVGEAIAVAGGNEYDFAEGGYSEKTIRATTEVLDVTALQQGWQMGPAITGGPRGWSASLVAQERLFVFGGVTWEPGGDTKGIQETASFVPSASAWTRHTPPPLPVSGWEGALYRGRYAILVGGVVHEDEVTWSDLALVYDTAEDRWLRAEGVLPPGAVFNDPGVAILGGQIFVLGAEGPFGSHYNYFLRGQIRPEAGLEEPGS